ncbi:MAG: nicotinate (nicotinamide) nucleotide adenylyltransferase [Bdellovibrionales bacterium]|jgi:nicotinate-nucleotide adenylyltransferase|nr:nicotinate (nicotinamide) nucleotide adenylyltransferase [Bdellovibrionales bacterium]
MGNENKTVDGEVTRIGVFGGTFNPLHVGHIQCVRTVKSRLGLDRIHIVPAAQNPRKPKTEGPGDQDRLEMCRVGFQSDADYTVIDDREIKRGGLSYTVTTLESFAEEFPSAQLHLIIGMDQFEELDRWHRVARIFELANVVVISRPGHSLPHGLEDFPEGLRPLLSDFEKGFGQLVSGNHIEFIRMPDTDVSASELRKRLRTGRSVEKYMTIEVEEFIKSRGLYAPIGPRIGDFEQFTQFCAEALFAKKGINVRGFDLRPTTAPTEFALIASGTSTRHTSALAESVLNAVKDEFNVFPQSVEGMSEGRWVLLDYGSLIVHVFYDFARQEYRLEELWRDARELTVKDPLAR